jgi:3-methyladenine DNA glycosylase Mpg
VAHEGRRHQHLASREAPAVPPQGPTGLSGGTHASAAASHGASMHVDPRRSPPISSAGSWSAGRRSGVRLAARIVETEAYEPHDSGEPRLPGRTSRERRDVRRTGAPLRVFHVRDAPLHERGHRGDGEGMAVLRSGLSRSTAWTRCGRGGDACSMRDLCSGPAKLCQAFGVDRRSTAPTSCRGHDLWIAEGTPVPDARIVAGPRVGIRVGNEYRVALLGGGRSVRCRGPAPRSRSYGLGEDTSFDTVIITELVWNAETPAAGLCEITVPRGCVETPGRLHVEPASARIVIAAAWESPRRTAPGSAAATWAPCTSGSAPSLR